MDMKRDYHEDILLFKTKTVLAGTVSGPAASAFLPCVAENYALYVAHCDSHDCGCRKDNPSGIPTVLF